MNSPTTEHRIEIVQQTTIESSFIDEQNIFYRSIIVGRNKQLRRPRNLVPKVAGNIKNKNQNKFLPINLRIRRIKLSSFKYNGHVDWKVQNLIEEQVIQQQQRADQLSEKQQKNDFQGAIKDQSDENNGSKPILYYLCDTPEHQSFNDSWNDCDKQKQQVEGLKQQNTEYKNYEIQQEITKTDLKNYPKSAFRYIQQGIKKLSTSKQLKNEFKYFLRIDPSTVGKKMLFQKIIKNEKITKFALDFFGHNKWVSCIQKSKKALNVNIAEKCCEEYYEHLQKLIQGKEN